MSSTTPRLATDVALTPDQLEALELARLPGGLFLSGRPRTGKTTVLQHLLATLLLDGHRPDRILVLLPQRLPVAQYERALVRALAGTGAPTCGGVDAATFYGLCRRWVALYWPLVAEAAGFAHPEREPVFLTIETAQYFMWRIVEPLVARKGYFSELRVRRERLLSQLLDNLNKSALVGFPHTEVGERLARAWAGGGGRPLHYRQAQECAGLFREYCLEHNLLDLSLTCELVRCHLLANPRFLADLSGRYRWLFVDNLEENVPVAHDLIRLLMGYCEGAVLAMDTGGGYRVFLGADAEGARELGETCDRSLHLRRPVRGGREVLGLAERVAAALGVDVSPDGDGDGASDVRGGIVAQGSGQYWIGMVRWVAERIRELVAGGVPPGEIAVVAPYVSDVMRFVLEDELRSPPPGIPVASLRPSQPFREDPLVRGILTLAWLAHPTWEIDVAGQSYGLGVEDVALALEVALAELDSVRAYHLADHAYRPPERALAPLTHLVDGDPRAADVGRMWEEVGYRYREPCESLRRWIADYREEPPQPLHIFLSRLFGEVLSRPGFGFHLALDRARAYARLVESAAKFAEGVGASWVVRDQEHGIDLGEEYASLVLGGIAGGEYLVDRPEPDERAVVLAPAYAYLTRDLHSRHQFWVDLASEGWLHRPNQPLTHPYVLSRRWPVGRPWTDTDEDAARRRSLAAVLRGLAARCDEGVYLASSELGIGGEEQSGRLQRAVLTALTRGRGDG